MAFLQVENIRKEYPGVVALDEVDFSAERGRVHVLAGENGAGKSTLVKILTGVESPNLGTVEISGRNALENPALFKYVSYVPQELSLFSNMTVAENLFMPFHKSKIARHYIRRTAMFEEAEKYIERFKINARPEQLVKNIMVSDQQLLQIARASTNKDLQLLILDEPTSSLTVSEVERLFQIILELKEGNHAVLFISHKLDEMFEIGDEVTVLRNGRKTGHAAMDRISEADLIYMMSGEALDTETHFLPTTQTREPILEVKNLSGPMFEDVSFTLHKGEILGFAGLVGAGRSEVMQSMFGFLKSKSGRITMDGQPWKLGDTGYSVDHGMLYLSETRKDHGILPLLSLRENIGISIFEHTVKAGVISHAKEKAIAADIINSYDIKTSSMKKKIMYLSGGNQQKAIIGRAMACQPKVLIFDEPTKGIDVKTKIDIYMIMKQLAERGIGIILISSEMNELQKCANRIIAMYQGRINGEFITEETEKSTLVGAILGVRENENAA